jgi:hypothetical protein
MTIRRETRCAKHPVAQFLSYNRLRAHDLFYSKKRTCARGCCSEPQRVLFETDTKRGKEVRADQIIIETRSD